ncbi:unnamed protein product [Trypanosoma congolense IL3000]|uniref:WGS project CAEQ00000000 data, annotated contig 19 n=2 Tax=Trypanosoma congolense (strain IL3000) TaxID=1068625 RepID=F9W9Z7_TRYCI|nr:unnamed protein product [Trypanosoma congolense IL3000]
MKRFAPSVVALIGSESREIAFSSWLGSAVRRNVSSSTSTYCGWFSALNMAELSRLCKTLPVHNSREHQVACDVVRDAYLKRSHENCSISEKEAVAYLLKHCCIPSESWWLSLMLLCHWRKLQESKLSTGSHKKDLTLFPPGMSPTAAAQLMRSLSLFKGRWVDTLSLYEGVAHSSTGFGELSTVATKGNGSNNAGDQKKLRWMRHAVLTALLEAGRWSESLHFYQHMLYQHDAPSHICTGYLVQRLGGVGRWEEVCNIFELNLRILHGIRHRDSRSEAARKSTHCLAHAVPQETTPRRRSEWGTMFSMALDAVSRTCRQPQVAQRMFNEACTVNAGGALFQWDGNFLSAAQALPGENERNNMLHRARTSNQLDYFKLVRGLNYHGKWLDALNVFAEAVETKQLSRKEIGRCRLNIFYASDVTNIQLVLPRLQKLCMQKMDSLRLNDSEIECIFAKQCSMATQGTTSNSLVTYAARPHWSFCIEILSKNYPDFLEGRRNHLPVTKLRRLPTSQMISMLLRNSMPWLIALRLLTLSVDLGMCVDREDVNNADSSRSVALMVNHVADIMYSQGRWRLAVDVLNKMSRKQLISPSVKMLEYIPIDLLKSGVGTTEHALLKVEDKVLYHFLHTIANWSRALAIVCAVIEQRNGFDEPLASLPASVHCEALKMLRRCSPHNGWILSLRYFSHVLPDAQLSGVCKKKHIYRSQQWYPQSNELMGAVYSIMYEVLLNILALPSSEFDTHKEMVCLRLLDTIMSFCRGRIPAHMLLPNQMDRLLPRSLSSLEDMPNIKTRLRIGLRLVRCVIEMCPDTSGVSVTLHSKEHLLTLTVMLHELQKLLCRVAEHRCHLMETGRDYKPSQSEWDLQVGAKLLSGQKKLEISATETGLLWRTSLELLLRQCQWCGVSTMTSGTLKLVYQTCASAGKQWKAALLATEYLLREQRQQQQVVAQNPVVPDHCSRFCSLFGWEKALGFWCTHFPQRTLGEVVAYPKGAEYCMNFIQL